ncbi:hypothetical protein MesoLjLc_25280 [Mesorhizobium sp. L-8-10]|nr:hypothetical protein MesoLjLc_25280 [Mesorhizobium sp. L-8-10]
MRVRTGPKDLRLHHQGARASRVGALVGASLVLLGAPHVAAGNEQGRQIAATCASCHDPAGGEQGIPTLVGLDEQAIVRALKAYRTSEAPSHVMHAVALSLTDEEFASVAHYIATSSGRTGSP